MIGSELYTDTLAPKLGGDMLHWLDALRRECYGVTIRALHSQAEWCWEVELIGVAGGSLSYSATGVTIEEAAGRLARWHGIDIE